MRRLPTLALALLAPALLASALLVGCASFPRRLEYATMRSTAMRDAYLEYGVFVPPGRGDAHDEDPLPVVVFLHGGGDGPDCLDRHGVSAVLEAGMRDGSIPRALIVVPEGDLGFWANWYDGSRRYEDWVVDEVLPAVQRRFRTLACPEGCHLMGISMGAEGALRIAMHRPGTFASVAAISGPAMDTDRRIAFMEDPLINIVVPTHHVFGPPAPRSRIEADDPFVRWQSSEDVGGMRIFLAWGTHDRDMVIEGSEALDRHLDEHGIAHARVVFEGGHDWDSWRPVIPEALRAQLGSAPAAPASSSAPASQAR